MFKHFRVKMLLLTLGLVSLENMAQETETRTLADFERIISTASIDVIITHGISHTARIETENISVNYSEF